MTTKQFEFWKDLAYSEFNIVYDKISYVLEPDNGYQEYTIVGFVNDHGKPNKVILDIDLNIYNKFNEEKQLN